MPLHRSPRAQNLAAMDRDSRAKRARIERRVQARALVLRAESALPVPPPPAALPPAPGLSVLAPPKSAYRQLIEENRFSEFESLLGRCKEWGAQFLATIAVACVEYNRRAMGELAIEQIFRLNMGGQPRLVAPERRVLLAAAQHDRRWAVMMWLRRLPAGAMIPQAIVAAAVESGSQDTACLMAEFNVRVMQDTVAAAGSGSPVGTRVQRTIALAARHPAFESVPGPTVQSFRLTHVGLWDRRSHVGGLDLVPSDSMHRTYRITLDVPVPFLRLYRIKTGHRNLLPGPVPDGAKSVSVTIDACVPTASETDPLKTPATFNAAEALRPFTTFELHGTVGMAPQVTLKLPEATNCAMREESFVCPVCNDPKTLLEAHVPACGHPCCAQCVSDWAAFQDIRHGWDADTVPSCPICRSTANRVAPVFSSFDANTLFFGSADLD